MEQAIVAAAGELFERQGFNQTSLQDIADVLGMARPSLYHYFKNREEILAAGIDQLSRRRDQVVRELNDTKGTPAERLELLILGLGRLVSENQVWIRVLLRDAVALQDDVRDRDSKSRLAYFEMLVAVIRAGIEEGYVRPLDERSTALTMISALIGLQGDYAAAATLSPNEATELAVDIILRGVLETERSSGTTLERGLRMIDDGLTIVRRNAVDRRSTEGER